MVLTLFLGAALGAVLGGLLGSLRTCPDGGCPLTATPRRGALWGAAMGLLLAFAMGTGRAASGTAPDGEKAQADAQAKSAVVAIPTAEEFTREVTSRKGKAVVYFHAEWCGACKVYKPTFEKVARANGEQIAFLGVDIDKVPDLAATHRIEGVPTTLVFENGKEVRRLVGAVREATLVRALGVRPAQKADEPSASPRRPVLPPAG